MTFDGANKYCEESIEKLQQLAHYVKERKKIEEEYAHSLRKLCKSVSLKPFKKDDWFEESDKSSVSRTTLWKTFYEIIDDTAQISKSHDAFADSLKNQLLEPILAEVKRQRDERRVIQDAAEELVKKVNDAKAIVKRSFSKHEEALEKHAEYQATCERYNATGRIKDYDKMLTKVRAAKQKLDDASDKHEDAKAHLERLRSSVERTESPRLMAKMRELEAARMKMSLGHLLELIELERRCASMDERYACEMVAKLKQIDLNADDQHFTRMHIDQGINTGAMVTLTAAKQPLVCTPPSPKVIKEDPPRYTIEGAGYPIISDMIPEVVQPPAYSMENLKLDGPSYAELSQQRTLSRSLITISNNNLACSAGNVTYF